MSLGITRQLIHETPLAVIDFETTGLTPGIDRVIEVSVVRIDPGQKPKLLFDTLVNPMRSVAATEIHGITDEDVASAPRFEEIAGELVSAISDCVVAAYNVYFDIKFLRYELEHSGVFDTPPHFCLMYMRPMLGLGTRCKLEEACRLHHIDHESAHIAATDAQASAKLLQRYLEILKLKKILTFSDLADLKNYKFVNSFQFDPLRDPSAYSLTRCKRITSRAGHSITTTKVDPSRHALGEYWDELRTVVADLEITDEEVVHLIQERERLSIPKEQVRVLHARAFASAISQFVDDQWLDDREAEKLRRLHRCLTQLGWAPGD